MPPEPTPPSPTDPAPDATTGSALLASTRGWGCLGQGVRLMGNAYLLLTVAFVTLGPPWCILIGLGGGVVVMSGLGLVIDWLALRTLLEPLRPGTRRAILGVSVAHHLVALVIGVWMVLVPELGAWREVPGTEGIINVALSYDRRDGLLVLGAQDRAYRLHTMGGERRDTGFRGPLAWELGRAPEVGLWVAARDEAVIHTQTTPDAPWVAWPRPEGPLQSVAFLGPAPLVVVGGALWTSDHVGAVWRRLEPGHRVTSVAAPRPDDGASPVLALGNRWSQSDDDGLTWRDVTPPGDLPMSPEGAVGGGWRYAYGGGPMSAGAFYAGAPDGPMVARTAPAPDMRTAIANPRRGAEVWVATWGQGVFRSLDGGQSWQDVGLQRLELRTLAADWDTGRVWTASSNLIGSNAVYQLDMSSLPTGER